MISLRCQCENLQPAAESALGKPVPCKACGAVLRPVAPGPLPGSGDIFTGRLIIKAGPRGVGEQVLLGGNGPIEIGKSPERAIVLIGDLVSRMHARLIRAGDGWHIEDRQSTNGLGVNGKRVRQAELHNGDRIRVGEYELHYAGATARAEPSLLAEELEAGAYELDAAALPAVVERPVRAAAVSGGPACPSCGRALPPGGKICVPCGINIETGKPLLTAQRGDLNQLYVNTETTARLLSIFLWLGIFPVSSEALGTRKPWAIWGITILTVIVSIWFLFYSWTDSPTQRSLKNLVLWRGGEPTPGMIEQGYAYSNWGDQGAYNIKVEQLRAQGTSENDAPVEAYRQLTPEQRCFGEFHWWQLITHIFLHAGLIHLAGNLVFLIVIGSRVNALVGNIGTVILYLTLGVVAALSHMASLDGGQPQAMVGASGAIMGMAGMYLVFFPIYKVHTVSWCRIFLSFRFKMWDTPGYAILIFYISFDVLYTLLGTHDGVAHWAHLGGFGAGMIAAAALLITRGVNARGGDLFSVVLGKRAWKLIGSPSQWPTPNAEGWLQRLRIFPGQPQPEAALAAVMAAPPPGGFQPRAAAAPAWPPPQLDRSAPISRQDREDRAGDRALTIAKWSLPVLIVVAILAYRYWPEPAFLFTPGSLVKKAPVQTAISDRKWWRQQGITLTPQAEYSFDAMVLGKASLPNILSKVAKWNLVVGWGAMSDPSVVSNLHLIQEAEGIQVNIYKPTTIPWDSLKAQVSFLMVIPASDAVLAQIEKLNVNDVATFHGKLVNAELPDGRVLETNLRRGHFMFGSPDVMWVESVTIVSGTGGNPPTPAAPTPQPAAP